MTDKKLSFIHNKIKLPNPFLLASSPSTRNSEMIIRAFEKGWGGAVLKTISLYPEKINNLSPRIYGHRLNKMFYGMQNIEMISDRKIEAWINDIKLIKDRFPDRAVIASIMAEGYNILDWQRLTELFQNAGADILELNLSCPHGVSDKGMGSFCSELPDLCRDIISAIKKVSKIPVWAKLSPNVTDIGGLAGACLQADADGIAAINTVKGFAGIDIETLIPRLSVAGQSTYGGFSGKMIKPLALKAVSEIYRDHKCYISATGGISDWTDIIEFILLGASSVQLCTEVMIKGFDIIKDIIDNIEDYLNRHNYSNISDIIGLGIKRIANFENLDSKYKANAKIMKENCRECGKCYISCRDGGYQAILQSESTGYFIDTELCAGCGLCRYVCPHNAIAII